MEQTLHKLDSHGDIILVLDEQDASYEDDKDFYDFFELPSPVNEEKIDKDPSACHNTRNDRMEKWSSFASDSEPEPEPGPEPEAEVDNYLDEDVLEEERFHTTQNSTPGSQSRPIRFQVSSKHLRLASPTFEIMLKREWTEGHTLNTQGTTELRALGATQEALRVFLRVRLLCEVTVLIDYYKAYNTLQFSSTLGSKMARDSIRWLCISWVFKHDEIFKSVTRVLQRQVKAPLQVSKIPISGTVIDKINQSREDAIEGIILALHDLVDNLESGKTSCNFDCDSIRLGALRKQLKSRGLLNPRPLSHISVTAFQDSVAAFARLESRRYINLKTEVNYGTMGTTNTRLPIFVRSGRLSDRLLKNRKTPSKR
ncbi:hypothetical protein MGYG_07884 [Nannizzia gypsea CBS 118893]|uniref:BTB domain-containing protein n=1 Tax=Arthroderma gypseum (strain ATCC MYA-4604 / CBS 118893) TaxID=535722 RepID=E4V4F9_ARTGP|nr:hypothetical protein MGYG_07884 [Nannizzia gypsea CBS 118893]EFR04883.1 hypothetical protein MGYG_07884 [Nannizzia gypsea CBS 118893]